MCVPTPEEFRRARNEGNDQLRAASPGAESLFALDGLAYAPGALPAATKELLGLVVSVATDCEDCLYYHLERCEQEHLTRQQVLEALQVALVGCGSVAVPMLRRALAFLAQLPGLAVEPGPSGEQPAAPT